MKVVRIGPEFLSEDKLPVVPDKNARGRINRNTEFDSGELHKAIAIVKCKLEGQTDPQMARPDLVWKAAAGLQPYRINLREQNSGN